MKGKKKKSNANTQVLNFSSSRQLSPELTEAVQGMDDNEMEGLLSELSNSRFWTAILRYNRLRDNYIIQGLSSVDPFKEPTLMAQYQGIRTGLFDLEELVAVLNEKKAADEEERTVKPE